MRQARDFPAHFELAQYDKSESVWGTFCENEKVHARKKRHALAVQRFTRLRFEFLKIPRYKTKCSTAGSTPAAERAVLRTAVVF